MLFTTFFFSVEVRCTTMDGPVRFWVGGGVGGFILLALEFARIFPQNNPILSTRNKQEYFHNTTYPTIPSVVYLCGFHTRYLHSVCRQPSPRSKFSPSRPMTLMTSQSLPLSSPSSVTIMCHSIALGGLAHKKILWLCNAFWLKTLIKVTKSPLIPIPLVFTQNKSATHPRIGLGLGSHLARRQVFFFFQLHWLENETLAGTFQQNHTDTYYNHSFYWVRSGYEIIIW